MDAIKHSFSNCTRFVVDLKQPLPNTHYCIRLYDPHIQKENQYLVYIYTFKTVKRRTMTIGIHIKCIRISDII